MADRQARALLWRERVMDGCLAASVDARELSQAFVHYATGSSRERLIALTVPHAVLNTDVSLYIGEKRWLPVRNAHMVSAFIDPGNDTDTVARRQSGIDCMAWAERLDLRVLLLSDSALLRTPMDAALLIAAEQVLADKDTSFLERLCDGFSATTRVRHRVLERLLEGTLPLVTAVLLTPAAPPCLLEGVAALKGVETLSLSKSSDSPLSDRTIRAAASLHRMRQLQHLNLGSTDITVVVMGALFTALPSPHSLFPLLSKLWMYRIARKADFSQYLTTEGVLPCLTDLRIDSCEADPLFVSALAQRRLRVLHLKRTGTTDGSFDPWAAVPKVPLAQSLLGLVLDRVTDEVLAHISAFPTLTTLVLRSPLVTGEALAQFLTAQLTLCSLELDNGLPLELPSRPAATVAVAPLESLSISSTRCDVASIVPWLNSTLRSLALPSCITTTDEAVLAAARGFPHLRTLDVRWCLKLTPSCFVPVAEVAPDLMVRQSVIHPDDAPEPDTLRNTGTWLTAAQLCAVK